MATADDLIADSVNYASDRASAAASAANAVFGLINKLLSPRFRAQPFWNPDDIPDLAVPLSPESVNRGDAGAVFPQPGDIRWTAGIQVPQRPNLGETLPTFTGTAKDPVFNGDLPATSHVVSAMWEAYKSALPDVRADIDSAIAGWMSDWLPSYQTLLAELERVLARSLTDGGMLEPGIEESILERAMARIDQEARAGQRQIEAPLQRRGFTEPAELADNARDLALRTEANRHSRAMTIWTKEHNGLALEHMEFCLGQSANLRGVFMSAFLTFAGIIYDAAQAAVQYAETIGRETNRARAQGIELYGAELEKYRADSRLTVFDAEIYRSQVAAYETKLTALLENYETDLKIVDAEVDRENLRIAAEAEVIDATTDQGEQKAGLWASEQRARIAAQQGSIATAGLALDRARIPYQGRTSLFKIQRELDQIALAKGAHEASGTVVSLAKIAGAASGILHSIGANIVKATE